MRLKSKSTFGQPSVIPPKFEDREYRTSFLASNIRRWLAAQIRVMRDMPERNWKQGDLARKMGKPQSVVSRLEDPQYGKMTVNTLLEVAEALDVAMVIKFVDYETFVCEYANVSDAAMAVQSFDRLRSRHMISGRTNQVEQRRRDFLKSPDLPLPSQSLGETTNQNGMLVERFDFQQGMKQLASQS